MSMESEIIQKTAEEVRRRLEGEGSGHDWWHVFRVWQMARRLGEEEGADLLVVELAALLHDIADWKFHNGDDTVGPKVAREIMKAQDVAEDTIAHVCEIIATMSFKGAGIPTEMRTIEGKIVQDADRLDAIGAIGIARTFAYGGNKGRLIHNPESKPILHQSKEEYFKSNGTTINHFYEKLLLLADRMNTKTGKKLAEGRHRFMEEYLERFHSEWNGQ